MESEGRRNNKMWTSEMCEGLHPSQILLTLRSSGRLCPWLPLGCFLTSLGVNLCLPVCLRCQTFQRPRPTHYRLCSSVWQPSNPECESAEPVVAAWTVASPGVGWSMLSEDSPAPHPPQAHSARPCPQARYLPGHVLSRAESPAPQKPHLLRLAALLKTWLSTSKWAIFIQNSGWKIKLWPRGKEMLNVLSGKSKVKRSCSPAVVPRAALESISGALFMFLGEKSSHGMQPTCPLCRQGCILATSNAGAQSGQTEEHLKQSMKPTHVSIRVSQWLSGKKSTCHCRTPGFHPWVGKTRWRRAWQPTLAFFPGESDGQRSLEGYLVLLAVHKESDTTEPLNNNGNTSVSATLQQSLTPRSPTMMSWCWGLKSQEKHEKPGKKTKRVEFFRERHK